MRYYVNIESVTDDGYTFIQSIIWQDERVFPITANIPARVVLAFHRPYSIIKAMYIKNRVVSLLYKVVFLIICGYGLYLNSGLPRGSFNPGIFVFFTILSNAWCFLYILLDTIAVVRRRSVFLPRFRGGIVISIMTTFLIYQFLLVPNAFSMGNTLSGSLSNTIVHFIVPVMMLAHWLLFAEKGLFKAYDPVIWASIPLAYLFFCLIRAQTGDVISLVNSRYPYFFIDVDALGGMQVFVNSLFFAVFYIGISYLLYLADRLMARRKTTS